MNKPTHRPAQVRIRYHAKRDTYYADAWAGDRRKQVNLKTNDYEFAKQRAWIVLGRLPVREDEDRFIHYRKPYIVRVRGALVGAFDTREEATIARDNYLKNETTTP